MKSFKQFFLENNEELQLDEVTVANAEHAFDLKQKAEAHKKAMFKHRNAPGTDSHEKFLKARTSFINAHKKLKALDLPKAELDQLRKGTNISESEELGEESNVLAKDSNGNPITMQDVRLYAGEGKLPKKTIEQAILIIKKHRAEGKLKYKVNEEIELDEATTPKFKKGDKVHYETSKYSKDNKGVVDSHDGDQVTIKGNDWLGGAQMIKVHQSFVRKQ